MNDENNGNVERTCLNNGKEVSMNEKKLKRYKKAELIEMLLAMKAAVADREEGLRNQQHRIIEMETQSTPASVKPLSWIIEYGQPTVKQMSAGNVVCNLNILLSFRDKPVANIVGCKVICDKQGVYRFLPASQRNGKTYFNFVGFSREARAAIVKKALRFEKQGKLVTRWSHRFDYNPRHMANLRVQDGVVNDKPAQAFVG